MRLSSELNSVLCKPILADQTTPCNLDKLDEALQEAHIEYGDEALKTSGRIDACLSGGLDSTLSLFILRKLFPDKFENRCVHTYTVVSDFDHPDAHHAWIVTNSINWPVIHNTITVPDNKREQFRKELQIALGGNPSNGEVAMFALYSRLHRELGVRTIIAHDGIDELMGGYWEHVEHDGDSALKLAAFEKCWLELRTKHIDPLLRIANYFSTEVLFPYLHPAVVDAIIHIPLDERTSRACRKRPLRDLAKKYGVPREIIERPKLGFCDALTIYK